MNHFKRNEKRFAGFRSLFLVALMTLFGITAHAQGITVKGTVIDAQGEPLIGASVLVKGTTNGGATDIDGNFHLQHVAKDAVLVFSYVGYEPQEINVNGQTTINVTLKEDRKSVV